MQLATFIHNIIMSCISNLEAKLPGSIHDAELPVEEIMPF